MADYVPAIQPTNYLGLYLEARRQREAQDAQRAALEARAQHDKMTALTNAAELAYKTGDAKWAIGLYDASTPMGSAGDYDVINSAAKAGKAKLALPNPGAQTDIAQGVAAQLQQPGDPLQNALAALRGIPETAGPLGTPLAIRGGNIAGQQQGALQQYTQKQDIQRAGQVEAARQTQANKAGDIVFSVRDKTGGPETADTIVGLAALRAARQANPNLIVTGKPTLVGTGEEVFGTPTKTRYAQLQDDVMHLDQASSDVGEAIGYIESNKALAGGIGTLTRAIGGGWQTLQELSGLPIAATIEDLADSTANKIADDVASGRIDPMVARDLTKALSDPNAPALDVLGPAIVYGYARALRGEGKLTVDDKERAENSVGIRTGLLTSSEQVLQRLRYIQKRLSRQQEIARKRLEFNKGRAGPAATAPAGGEIPGPSEAEINATLAPAPPPPGGKFDIDLMGGQ